MIPMFVINMIKSNDRRVAIKDAFIFDNLIWSDAVEGVPFDDKNCKRKNNIELLSSEIACAQSHMNVWKTIIKNSIPFSIVIEDDVKPVEDRYSIASIDYSQYLPFDVLFLQVNFKNSCVADSENNYVLGRGAHAYLITKNGAEKSIKSMTPIIRQLDVQWMSAFEKTNMFYKNCKPTKNIKAKVLKNGIIEHSPMARTTTFTTSGDKSWTDGWFKGGYK